MGLTQASFVAHMGAARKAVVYQWESRKRCSSPVFCQRIIDLGNTAVDARSTLGDQPLLIRMSR